MNWYLNSVIHGILSSLSSYKEGGEIKDKENKFAYSKTKGFHLPLLHLDFP